MLNFKGMRFPIDDPGLHPLVCGLPAELPAPRGDDGRARRVGCPSMIIGGPARWACTPVWRNRRSMPIGDTVISRLAPWAAAQSIVVERHVNIIAGRAVRDDGCCKVYGYVNREVTSAATRLDHFLSEQGTALDQKITIVSDGAGEFEKAVNGSKRPLTRILDWFHIAMKFSAIEQSALKFPDLLAPNGRTVQDEIASAKWLTWHGKGAEAVERIKSIHDMLWGTPEHPAYSALWWNLRGTYWYLESNDKYLVNYGWRYRRGMPISSSIAESAVNEVVSLRCAKNRQMRWTNKGAHLLVQVRVAVLNGDLKMREMPEPRRTRAKQKPDDRYQRLAYRCLQF